MNHVPASLQINAAASLSNCPRSGAMLAAVPVQRPFQRRQARRPCASSEAAAESPATTVKLGASDLEVSRLGIGTIQWGDTTKGFGPTFDEEDLYASFEAARVGGVNFFDTAEVYGYQSLKAGSQSEQLVGRFAKRSTNLPIDAPRAVLASKYFTIPWTNALIGGGFRLGRPAMIDALRASLKRLDVQQLDLWQIHFPFPTYPQNILAAGLQEATDLGLVKAVGVCNYNASQTQRMYDLLAHHNIPLASNQVKYSILDRNAETDGTLACCRDLGIAVIAHSPLQQGLLTEHALQAGDSATKQQQQSGVGPDGKQLLNDSDKPKLGCQVRPLLIMMQFIGALSGGRTVTQVALNWLIAKGTIPIPGAKTAAQAKEHVGALGWNLDDNEVAMIEEKLDAMKL